MKKIVILTSILALTACGGGSGGAPATQNDAPVISGDTNNTTDNNQSDDSTTQNDDTSDNNDNGNPQNDDQNNGGDTQPDDQDDDQNNDGDTQTDNTNNQNDNPQINNPGDNSPDTPVVPIDILNPDMLNNLGNNNVGDMFDGFRFVFDDNGNIIQFLLTDGVEGPNPVRFQRESLDTSRFSATEQIYTFYVDGYGVGDILLYEHIEDRNELADRVREKLTDDGFSESTINEICDNIVNDPNFGEWGEEVGTFQGDFHTLGKANGLRYSDFGHFTLDNYAFSFVYQGGIEDKKIDPSTMQTMGSIEFRGSAAAELQHYNEVNGEDQWEDPDNGYGNRLIATNTGDATLTFDNGTETISMPFNDWYTVNIQKTGDHIDSVRFTDEEKVQDESWRVIHRDITYPADSNSYHYFTNGSQIYDHMSTTMSTTYYGDNGTPSEATGFINHEDGYIDNEHHVNRGIWFDAVFGGKKPE